MKTLLPALLLLAVLGAVFKLAYDSARPAPTKMANSDSDRPTSDSDRPAVLENAGPAAPVAKARSEPPANPGRKSQPKSPWAARSSHTDPGRVENPFVDHGRGGTPHLSWSSYDDAVDFVAAEIFDALEDRPTLVIWLFDSSPSAVEECGRVARRLESVYQTFDKAGHDSDSAKPAVAPLVSVVGTVGKSIEFLTPEPTDDSHLLLQAARSIRTDTSGEQHTFKAIDNAVKRFGKQSASEKRLMLVVVVTNQVGDDAAEFVDELMPRLRKNAIAVYVIGPSAPFGAPVAPSSAARAESKRPVRQGPESLMSETIDLGGWNGPLPPLDSGFGPFGLSRIAIGSGGHYLAVRKITGFDPERMAAYAPDYVSRAAYEELLQSNKARRALVEASRLRHIDLAGHLETVFPKKDEAGFKRTLDKAQQRVARLEPLVKPVYDAISAGEADRPRLTGPRWQAGFDLAMGRASAARSRVEGYNAALAQMKMGRSFPDSSHNTWVLRPTGDVKGDSGLEKLAKQARKYLERVVDEHPDTPWATVATRELATPLGWEWTSK